MGLCNADFELASAEFLAAFGETLSYTAKHEDPVSFTGVLGDEKCVWFEEQDRRVKRRERTVMLSTDPTGTYGGVASPALKGIVTVNGEPWNIESINPVGGGYVDLVIVRVELDQRAAAVYRGK